MSRVSAIIPAYNAASFLPNALESVLRQSYTDWEIILVDDGSTDDTRAVVQSQMRLFDGRLHYVYQANQGLSVARNTAICHAKGQFIALLDADDVWLENRLELGVEMMDRNPKMGLVHGKVVRINIQGEIIWTPPHPPAESLRGNIARQIFNRKAHLLCPTILFRKECIGEVGGFDELMRSTEDRDLWFRIAQKYEVGYIEEIIAYYRISSNSMSRDLNRMMIWQTYFIKKHRQSPALNPLAARQAMGQICRERGDLVFKSDLRESLMWYGRSLLWYPFEAPNLYMFLRALGEPLRFKSRNPSGPIDPTPSHRS